MNRWPDHETFEAQFPDDTPVIAVADIFLTTIQKYAPSVDVRFTESGGADVCHFEVWREDVDGDEDDRRERYREHAVLEFFDDGKVSREISGFRRCEGKLTAATLAALETALTVFGGKLLVRGPRGSNEMRHEFGRSGDVPEISAFFRGVAELGEFMPLHGAVEVMKSAARPAERDRILDVVERFPSAVNVPSAPTTEARP